MSPIHLRSIRLRMQPTIYDLKNAQSVELTCSQPDYGFPAATTYTVQASLNKISKEATDDSSQLYCVGKHVPTAK